MAVAGDQDVLQAEAVGQLAWEAVGVRLRIQVFADQGTNKFPELIDVLVNSAPTR